MSVEYSEVQLFVRPIGPDVKSEEIEQFFSAAGPLKELRLMPGYAFIEYETPEDASKAFNDFVDQEFNGEKLQIEYAKQKPEYAKRGENRVKVSNLPPNTAWQDFKDFIREEVRLTPTFVKIPIEDPSICHLEFASREDLESAISQLNGVNYIDSQLSAEEDTSPFIASGSRQHPSRGRGGFRGGFRGRGGYRGGFAPRGGFRGAPYGGEYRPRGGFMPRGGYRDGPYGGDYRPRGGYRDGPPSYGGEYRPRGGYRGDRGGFAPRGGYRGDFDRGFRDGPPPMPSGPPRGEYRSARDGGDYAGGDSRDYGRERSPSRY